MEKIRIWHFEEGKHLVGNNSNPKIILLDLTIVPANRNHPVPANKIKSI